MRTIARVALATLAALALGQSSASADVRAGSVTDPQDRPESISGPRQPDLESVRVTYDTAGSLSVTARLYEAWDATNKYHDVLELSIGSAVATYTYGCSSYNPGDVTILGYFPDYGAATGTVRVSGYDGSQAPQRSVSPDGREITFSASIPAMAGRNYICGSGISLLKADPDGHCSPSLSNCQSIRYRYTGDTADDFFFDGFAPQRPACDDGLDNDGDGRVDLKDPGCANVSTTTSEGGPLPACDDGIDNDLDGTIDDNDATCNYGKTGLSEGTPPATCGNGRDDDDDGLIDLKDPGCKGKKRGTSEKDPARVNSTFKLTRLHATRRCRLDVEVEALPDLTPVSVFPFEKVIVRVKGISGQGRNYSRTRRLRLGDDPGYAFKLKPGRYRVSGKYPGDDFRRPSKWHTRTVKVCGG